MQFVTSIKQKRALLVTFGVDNLDLFHSNHHLLIFCRLHHVCGLLVYTKNNFVIEIAYIEISKDQSTEKIIEDMIVHLKHHFGKEYLYKLTININYSSIIDKLLTK